MVCANPINGNRNTKSAAKKKPQNGFFFTKNHAGTPRTKVTVVSGPNIPGAITIKPSMTEAINVPMKNAFNEN